MAGGMLQKLIDDLPAGRWAVGVSGGADSVALLLLLSARADLSLHVVHLDHQTRNGESARDAVFVADLAGRLHIPATIEKRSVIEAGTDRLAANISNRYRLARLAFFQRVVMTENLLGVVLAHHADDQAETVMMRMLRGAGPGNLSGIRKESVVNGLRIVRPLLSASSRELRNFLRDRGQEWREDSSNQSHEYRRNEVRHWLADRSDVRDQLLRIETASEQLRSWLEASAPKLDETFSVTALSILPLPLARYAAANWLVDRGSPPKEVSSRTCERLMEMCGDAASPARQHFPGGLLVRRKAGKIFVERI
jgi:tRNA(Ile)-lysidine synthetase-like protein